ncbi:MAG: TIGR02147 family protein, partial [Proteobacteria bacterium]
ANRLNMSSDEETYFVALVSLAHCKDEKQRQLILAKSISPHVSRPTRDLSIDHYHSVANWICAATIALLDHRPRGLTAEEIAERLDISKFEAEDALDRWVRLDVMGKNEKTHRYTKTSETHVRLNAPESNGALRAFHSSMLTKAAEALDSQKVSERFVGSETFSFDPKDLPAMNKILENAFNQILARAEKGRSKTAVYHLGIQMFSLTKKEK